MVGFSRSSSSHGRIQREFFSKTDHPQQKGSSHGTMKREGIIPTEPHKKVQKSALVSLDLLSKTVEVNNINGPNKKENCLICSVASILGLKATDIVGEHNQKATFFGRYNNSHSSGIDFDDQVNGVKRFLSHNLSNPIIREYGLGKHGIRGTKTIIEATHEMMKYPKGTKFLVYTDDGLQNTHWVSAERDSKGISFYDFQKKMPTDSSADVSSGPDSKTRSGSEDYSNPSIELGRTLEMDEIHLDADIQIHEETKSDVPIINLFSYTEEISDPTHMFLDTLPISREKPYPVKYENGERYIMEPQNVGFISIQER